MVTFTSSSKKRKETLASLHQTLLPDSANNSNKKSTPSHVVVDLSSNKVEAALQALHNLRKLAAKVKSATVHANSLMESRCGRVTFDKDHVESVLEALATLPRLSSLTIELNFHVLSLPVSALNKFFQTSTSLKRLRLNQLQLVGSPEEFDQLAELATNQTSLHYLTVTGCRGTNGIQALLDHLPALSDVKVVNTALAPPGNLEVFHLTDLVENKKTLKSLHLEDITDLEDDHCLAITRALYHNTSLQTFYISSSMLSDVSAHALAKMLLLNTTMERVTLHLDAECLGVYMAPVLQANTTLQKLDIRMYQDLNAVTESCLLLAVALQHNTSLQALRLRLEIELETLPAPVLQAFSQAIHSPSVVLGSLSLDDGTYRHPLTADMKLQLQLNQTGVNGLLRKDPQDITLKDQVETLIQTTQQHTTKGDNLNATFYLLQNAPQLIQAALENANTEQSSTGNQPSPTSSRTKRKDPISSTWKIPMPSLLRRPKAPSRNILAPSA